MTDKQKKVMLITGSRKGIGKYLSEYYALKGYFVVGCSRKEADWQLPNYKHYIVDVCIESQVKKMITEIRRGFGRLDVLINNAGIATMNHTILMPKDSAEKILNINLLGVFLMCREAAKVMRRNRYGRIINFSTVAVPMNIEGEAMYAASKAGVEKFSKIFAKELSDFGITCNVVGPSPIYTDLIMSVPEKKIKNIIGKLAIKRIGRFEDVSNVIDFFIKPESSYITGQIVYLGGAG